MQIFIQGVNERPFTQNFESKYSTRLISEINQKAIWRWTVNGRLMDAAVVYWLYKLPDVVKGSAGFNVFNVSKSSLPRDDIAR